MASIFPSPEHELGGVIAGLLLVIFGMSAAAWAAPTWMIIYLVIVGSVLALFCAGVAAVGSISGSEEREWEEAKEQAHKRYEENPHLPKVHLGNYHEARRGEGYLMQGEPSWLFPQVTLECLRRYAAQIAPYHNRDLTFDQVYTDLWACREVLKVRYNSIHRAARQDLRGRSSYGLDQARDLYEAMHFFARRQNRYDELIAKAEADYDELDDPYGKDYSWLARSDRLRDAQHRELVDACVKVATHQGSMWT